MRSSIGEKEKKEHGHIHVHQHDEHSHDHSHDHSDHHHEPNHDHKHNDQCKHKHKVADKKDNTLVTIIEPSTLNENLISNEATNIHPSSKSYHSHHSHAHKAKSSHDHDHHGHSHDHGENEHDHTENMNVKSAMIHVIGDIIQSIGVIIAAIVVKVWPEASMIDSIGTFIFAIVIIITTIPLMWDCIKVLMESTPKKTSITQIEEDLQAISYVTEVHDLHVWALNNSNQVLTVHLKSTNPMKSLKKATRLLNTKYRILHTTIQVEEVEDSIENYICDLYH